MTFHHHLDNTLVVGTYQESTIEQAIVKSQVNQEMNSEFDRDRLGPANIEA